MGNHNKLRMDKNGEILNEFDVDMEDDIDGFDANVEIPIDDPS